jgi:hypothetical protein
MRTSSIAGAAAVALALLLAACSNSLPGSTVMAEAFAGPAELKIRSDIPPDSAVVDVLHHGDRVEILGQRRGVFLRVRTAQGKVGWIESRQLLSKDEMDSLRELAGRARGMLSLGAAATYADLRVHTSPSRTSPSFILLKENDKVDVLGYVSAPRAGSPRKPLLSPPPKPVRKKAAAPGKSKDAEKYPPPPRPKSPAPPPNWVDLSQPALEQAGTEDDEPDTPEPQTQAPPKDAWSLVRTASGQCGWALTRALFMAIPDEVAQYAERKRIVSYFSLGEVRDGDDVKKNWVWATSSGGEEAEFDSFRVFVWSVRRHRYETAYIERTVKGFLPVKPMEVEMAVSSRARGSLAAAQPSNRYPGFAVCVEKADGQKRWRKFAFIEPSIRLAGEEPCQPPPPLAAPGPGSAAAAAAATAAQPPKEGFGERAKRWLAAVTPNWLKRKSK